MLKEMWCVDIFMRLMLYIILQFTECKKRRREFPVNKNYIFLNNLPSINNGFQHDGSVSDVHRV